MATVQELRDRVLHILLCKTAWKVDFTFDGIDFTGKDLMWVAMAISLKAGGNKGIGIQVGGIAADAEAQYAPSENMLKFPDALYGATADQREGVFHECIHAHLDMNESATTALTDESMAFIGGMLFYIHDNTPEGDTPTTPGWATAAGTTYEEAYRIALGLYTSKSKKVSDADAKAMRERIASIPAYEHLKNNPTYKYNNDGVWK